jgi:hypothetical protein
LDPNLCSSINNNNEKGKESFDDEFFIEYAEECEYFEDENKRLVWIKIEQIEC